ncbi:unnamed protein product [Amoebophrya sp. A120]|nr:unnamed protein product [Amoebophrya sp. A120]|eukprot:GSA120T00004877001.1
MSRSVEHPGALVTRRRPLLLQLAFTVAALGNVVLDADTADRYSPESHDSAGSDRARPKRATRGGDGSPSRPCLRTLRQALYIQMENLLRGGNSTSSGFHEGTQVLQMSV